MKPKAIAIIGVLLTGAVSGAFDVLFAGKTGGVKLLTYFGPMVVALAFVFLWLHYDEKQSGYRRSALLDVGIVALTVVFLPVYLYRSRPRGKRAKALLGFLAMCLLWFGAAALGGFAVIAVTR